jgi:hypothetical protein
MLTYIAVLGNLNYHTDPWHRKETYAAFYENAKEIFPVCVPGYALHSSEANDNTLIAYEDEFFGHCAVFTAVGFEADDVDNALKIAKRSLPEQFEAKVRLEWAIDNSERNGALYRVYAVGAALNDCLVEDAFAMQREWDPTTTVWFSHTTNL